MRRIVNRAICSRRDTENHSLTSVVPGPGRAWPRTRGPRGGTPRTPRRCRSPSPARRRPGCTRSGRTARSRPSSAGAARSAGSTTGPARARSARVSATTDVAARVEVLHEALDRAALAGGVAALEQDHQLLSGLPHPRWAFSSSICSSRLVTSYSLRDHPLVVRVALPPRLDRQAVRARSGPGRRSRPTCRRPTGRAPASSSAERSCSASMTSDRSTTDSMSTKRSSISCSLRSRVRAR